MLSFSQDCKTLDNFVAFHGVKFGSPFPDSLRKYCQVKYNQQRSDSIFMIWEEEVKKKKQFQEWVNVRQSFSYAAISALKDGRVYLVLLQHPINIDDTLLISQKFYPLFYSSVCDELMSVFGKFSKEEIFEDLFSKELVRTWDCEKMKIEFSMGLTTFRTYTLTITDKKLDKERKILKYTN